MKTLSFFAAASNTCCSLARESDCVDVLCEYDSDTPGYNADVDDLPANCKGDLVLVFDKLGCPRLQYV
jgi:hypothetical protein